MTKELRKFLKRHKGLVLDVQVLLEIFDKIFWVRITYIYSYEDSQMRWNIKTKDFALEETEREINPKESSAFEKKLFKQYGFKGVQECS